MISIDEARSIARRYLHPDQPCGSAARAIHDTVNQRCMGLERRIAELEAAVLKQEVRRGDVG